MVEDYTVMRGGLSSSTGRNCEIANSVGHGILHSSGKRSGRSQGISETSGCGNHDSKLNKRTFISITSSICTCMAEVLMIIPLEERISKFGSHYEQSKDLITAPEYKKNQEIIIYRPVAKRSRYTKEHNFDIIAAPGGPESCSCL